MRYTSNMWLQWLISHLDSKINWIMSMNIPSITSNYVQVIIVLDVAYYVILLLIMRDLEDQQKNVNLCVTKRICPSLRTKIPPLKKSLWWPCLSLIKKYWFFFRHWDRSCGSWSHWCQKTTIRHLGQCCQRGKSYGFHWSCGQNSGT